jgi:hypothetical protein
MKASGCLIGTIRHTSFAMIPEKELDFLSDETNVRCLKDKKYFSPQVLSLRAELFQIKKKDLSK